jgi:energy-converting hydrogenase Eha subunit A
MPINSSDTVNIIIILATALILGLIISLLICKIGKNKNHSYDWKILWLSVSIIALVVEVVFWGVTRF